MKSAMTIGWLIFSIVLAPGTVRGATDSPMTEALLERYVESYFQMYPSRATAAGRHDFDRQLEDFSSERLSNWIEVNRRVVDRLEAALAGSGLDFETRLDAELVLRQARRELFAFEDMDRSSVDPMLWSGIAANATIYLLLRDDLPEAERLASAAARARQIPRLVSQAKIALAGEELENYAPELTSVAAHQARSTATFYSEGFPALAEGQAEDLARAIRSAANAASTALGEFADRLDDLAEVANGSPRLGDRYPELFRLVTGDERPIAEVLDHAEQSLAAKRAEAAAFGRGVWSTMFPDQTAPVDDLVLLRRLFERVAADGASSREEFVADFRTLVDEAREFVRRHDVITVPEPITLFTGRSPSFFVGQSVGGVYPAGPYAPNADTLFLLPMPSDAATAEQEAAFYRDFNHHFNTMITPHEMIPGHYLQLKRAALHPRKIRSLFSDGVYVEGWGTFCERLMLDLGWGGPLDRLAHYKKQMENIARTIVDIGVHTQEMSRDEVIRLARDDAMQDAQFAANLWMRSITSAPQLTYYFLGYRQVWGLYRDVRDAHLARGEPFKLKTFMDGMMELGPVSVEHYRRRMLPKGGDAATEEVSP